MVGATTQIVESISSTGGVDVIGDDVNDMAALAAIVQQQIDALTAQGVNKIVLVSQLQELENEAKLISFLHDVDIVIGGGSNTLLSDSTDVLRQGDVSDGEYAQIITNAGGDQTILVNTDGNYKYVGRLVVDFDSEGHIIPGSLDPNVNGAYATDDAGLARVYDGTGIDPFAEGSKGDTVRDLTTVIDGVISVKDGVQFGRTDVYLDGRRGEVRSQETNLGDLTADANLWYAQQTTTRSRCRSRMAAASATRSAAIEAIGGTAVELPPAAQSGRRQRGRRGLPARHRQLGALQQRTAPGHAHAGAAARGAGKRRVGTRRAPSGVRPGRRHRILVRCDADGAGAKLGQRRGDHSGDRVVSVAWSTKPARPSPSSSRTARWWPARRPRSAW